MCSLYRHIPYCSILSQIVPYFVGIQLQFSCRNRTQTEYEHTRGTVEASRLVLSTPGDAIAAGGRGRLVVPRCSSQRSTLRQDPQSSS